MESTIFNTGLSEIRVLPDFLDEDKDTYYTYRENNFKYKLCWNRDGLLTAKYYKSNSRGVLVKHRENGPAVECRYGNGNIKMQLWYKFGKLHNDNGPAIKEYRENGTLKACRFYVDGNITDPENGPAVRKWHKNGMTKLKYWYGENLSDDYLENNQFHYLKWYRSGQLKTQRVCWGYYHSHEEGEIAYRKYNKNGTIKKEA